MQPIRAGWIERLASLEACRCGHEVLEDQRRLVADQACEGFVYEGQRVPLMGPKGICEPRVVREIPISIT